MLPSGIAPDDNKNERIPEESTYDWRRSTLSDTEWEGRSHESGRGGIVGERCVVVSVKKFWVKKKKKL